MDASEKYIEMCRAAEEIQKLKPTEADARTWFYCTEHKRFLEYNSELGYQWCGSWNDWHSSDGEERVIWLPRQDQLQDIINGDTGKATGYGFMREFHGFWINGHNREYISENNFCTHEQLLLAYAMEIKYGKRWDGAAWIDPNVEKKPTESVFSQIRRAHAKVEADNFKPIEIHMPRKMELALSLELAPYQISTRLQLGVDVSILGMRLIIDDTMSDDEFRIVAELL